MFEWRKISLGEICKTNTTSYSNKEGWKFVNYLDTGSITGNEIEEIQYIDLTAEKLPSRAKRKVRYNSIVYSTVRPNQLHYGIIKEQPDNFLVSTGFTVIDVDENVADAEYVYYWLIQSVVTEQLQALAEQSTSAYPSIKSSDLEALELELPPLKIQKMIAGILVALDKKRKNNTQINRNLSEQVAALYKAWFIDFERNDGVCPEEWKEATLGDIAEIGSGKRPPMKQTDKTDDVCIPLIGAASIMGYTNSVLYDSKILVTGRVGTHGVVQRFNNECWPSDNTLVITTDKYEFVNQILLRIDYKSMNRGSTQPLITQGDLKKTEIILPTDAILDEFEALAGGLMNQYEKNILENAKLSELRDTLLPKLMSGELDVSDMDF